MRRNGTGADIREQVNWRYQTFLKFSVRWQLMNQGGALQRGFQMTEVGCQVTNVQRTHQERVLEIDPGQGVVHEALLQGGTGILSMLLDLRRPVARKIYGGAKVIQVTRKKSRVPLPRQLRQKKANCASQIA
jgi:hypothetical protein